MTKDLQPKLIVAINLTKFDKSTNPPYSKYSFVKKKIKNKVNVFRNITCYHFRIKGHKIADCKLKKILTSNSYPQLKHKCDDYVNYPKGPNEYWVPSSSC